MKRLLTEPLMHFLLIGAALFAAFSLVSDDAEPGDDQIVVSSGKIEHLAALFARTWQRPPTRAEMDGLINDYVREEVAYREGVAIGLDRDDTIIRRRIRQKLEFVAEDLITRDEPSDAELAAYLAEYPEKFRLEPRLTFRQVYLNPESRGPNLESTARELLITLNGDPSIDAAAIGDRILLEHGYADVTLRDVSGLFGEQFAAAVAELEASTWNGPIESGYGAHLVIIDQRTDGRVPALDEVREQVQREWDNARRLDAIERFYDELLKKYEVIIEWPNADPPSADS